jgi:subtilisin family serine protease
MAYSLRLRERSSVVRGMTGRILVACACVGAALGAAASAPGRTFHGLSARADYSIGYTTTSALDSAVGNTVARIPALRIARVRLTAEAAVRVSQHPGIRFVQRARERASQTEPGLQAILGKSAAWEWQFAAAHEDTVPESVLRAASAVTIAVIDTGADLTAPDIAAKNPVAFGQRAQNVDVRDSVGHGTFVSALATGSVTNGEGIAGFGGDAKLMVVKAGAGDGSLTDADEAAALAYAVDHGARIINISFGGTTSTATEKSAIDYAAAHGVLVVAAAGNNHLVGNPTFYPAALLQPLGSKGAGGLGLAVAASTETGERAPFSSTGTYVSLAAPGEGVFSAVSSTAPLSIYPRVPLPGSTRGLYGYGSGTSFAAPEVAGAAALVMAANPLLGATDVARVLKESASGGGTWTPELGFGVIDATAAVALATGATAEASRAGLRLSARVVKQRVTLTATLSSLLVAVSSAGRTITFERQVQGKWKRFSTTRTDAAGRAQTKLSKAKMSVKLRARWAGSIELAGAASNTLTLR